MKPLASAFLPAVLAAGIATGCSGSAMTEPIGPSPDAVALEPGEGLIYGSFLVVVDDQAVVPDGAYVWYGPEDRRTRYEMNLHRIGSVGAGTNSSHRFVRAKIWEPEPFVAKVRAGRYAARRMNMYQGTADRISKRLVDTHMKFEFDVEPGKATYVGRLVVAVPHKMIPRRTKVRYWVEDHGDADVAAIWPGAAPKPAVAQTVEERAPRPGDDIIIQRKTPPVAFTVRHAGS